MITPVILCGGAGARLWPLSRANLPKQFLALLGDDTLLQATVRRLGAVAGAAPPIVVCNADHRFLVAEQLRAAGVVPGAILLEPAARGTAPATAAAALEALARAAAGSGTRPDTGTRTTPEPTLLVLPADHVIRDTARFAAAVRAAATPAAAGGLVTFGVAPTGAETGFGYIKAARPGEGGGAAAVERFVEKPDADTAAGFVAEGGWLWNSGMFVFGAGRFLDELREHARDVLDAVTAAHRAAVEDLGFLRLDEASFAASPPASVDRAVMERTTGAVVVPLDAGWADVGSWSALLDLGERDEAGNVTRGDVLLAGSRDTLVHAEERLVAAVGVSDLVVAETADAVLVAHRDAVGDVRKVVAALESAGRAEHRHNRRVHRPWGMYEVLHTGDGFQVKRVVVNPGGRLSLQSHRHRAEHWVVVRGEARVTCGEDTFMVGASRTPFIPAGARHRLANPGATPLEVVEVQTGACLDEDDIVRHDDAYGRANPDPQSDPRSDPQSDPHPTPDSTAGAPR